MQFQSDMEEKAMYCVKCGKELEDSVRYCSNCGQKVGGSMNRAAISLPKEEVKDAYEAIKNKREEFVEKKKKMNMGSLICMIIAAILCCVPWFHLPRAGSYSPLEWYEFISSSSYYYGEKIYTRATIIPGICIWMNIPLVVYIINIICIFKRGKGLPALNVVGLIFSVLTFIYAYAFFAYYNGYMLYGEAGCSMKPAFYLMAGIVFLDAIRSIQFNEQH